ncbi:MAG TPA: hypothetical protein V6D07_18780 [Trichocoleus sp.]
MFEFLKTLSYWAKCIRDFERLEAQDPPHYRDEAEQRREEARQRWELIDAAVRERRPVEPPEETSQVRSQEAAEPKASWNWLNCTGCKYKNANPYLLCANHPFGWQGEGNCKDYTNPQAYRLQMSELDEPTAEQIRQILTHAAANPPSTGLASEYEGRIYSDPNPNQ